MTIVVGFIIIELFLIFIIYKMHTGQERIEKLLYLIHKNTERVDFDDKEDCRIYHELRNWIKEEIGIED